MICFWLYVCEYFVLFGAKINHPSDFLFFLEVEVKTFFWQLHPRVFLVAIVETLAVYPGTVELLPKFKKSSYNLVKKSSLRNNIDKHFKHKVLLRVLLTMGIEFFGGTNNKSICRYWNFAFMAIYECSKYILHKNVLNIPWKTN